METSGSFTSGTEDFAHNGISKIDKASSGAHASIDKMSKAARPVVDQLASGAHQAVDKIAGAATTAAESLEAKREQLMEVQKRLAEEFRGYVRQYPLASLGVAISAGFLISRLFKSR